MREQVVITMGTDIAKTFRTSCRRASASIFDLICGTASFTIYPIQSRDRNVCHESRAHDRAERAKRLAIAYCQEGARRFEKCMTDKPEKGPREANRKLIEAGYVCHSAGIVGCAWEFGKADSSGIRHPTNGTCGSGVCPVHRCGRGLTIFSG